MKVFALPLLMLAAVSPPAFGQFVPPPESSTRNSVHWSSEAAFPLPDQASSRLTQPFDSTVETPDWKIARLMAELSFLAYEDSIPSVQNRLRLYDMALGEFVTVDNHQFITAWDQQNDVLVVAFRGTDIAQLADVWTDLDYEKVETELGEVHKGFYEASQALMRSVVAAIEHRGNPRHVWLTGHSLGGAIATLAMRQLELQGHRISGLVTFGQPRVGDHAFTKAMNRRLGTRMLRVINEDDVVASLPPRIPFVMPAYYSGGSVIQFLDGELKRSAGVRMMATPPILGGTRNLPPPPEEFEPLAPQTPSGDIPPDPEPLTAEQFEELKAILNDRDPINIEEQAYGGSLGGPFDRLDLQRRAGNHPIHLYIQKIEQFAAEGK